MELAVYWTRFAENKLDDIYDYYASKAGSRIALKLIAGIIYWINQNKNRIDIVNVFDTRKNPLKMKNENKSS